MGMEALIIILTAALTLTKLIDYFISKKTSKDLLEKIDQIGKRFDDKLGTSIKVLHDDISPSLISTSKATEIASKNIERLLLLHEVYDKDGIPIWYTPRSWIEMAKETADALREVSMNSKYICDTLKHMNEKREQQIEHDLQFYRSEIQKASS